MLEQKSTYISFIFFEKEFDWIDRDMLMYKLVSYNVDGKFYKAIRAMYNNTRAIVKVYQMSSRLDKESDRATLSLQHYLIFS